MTRFADGKSSTDIELEIAANEYSSKENCLFPICWSPKYSSSNIVQFLRPANKLMRLCSIYSFLKLTQSSNMSMSEIRLLNRLICVTFFSPWKAFPIEFRKLSYKKIILRFGQHDPKMGLSVLGALTVIELIFLPSICKWCMSSKCCLCYSLHPGCFGLLRIFPRSISLDRTFAS